MNPPARKRTPAASRRTQAASETASDSASDAAERDAGLPFEGALSRLEEIVDELEGGELELERSLAAFEEGVGLAKRCAQDLDRAERRIEVLTREGAEWLERPFAGVAEDADGEGG